jgi:uncharacterized protein (TIGR00297 family)
MTLFAVLTMIVYTALILSLRSIFPENRFYKYLVRKSIHMITGLILFVFTFYYGSGTIFVLVCLGVLISLATYFLRRFNFIHATSPASFGTLFYPCGILAALIILWNQPISSFRISVMILAVSDTFANFGGLIRKGNVRFNVLKEEKSIYGAASFAVTALIIHRILAGSQTGWDLTVLFIIAALNFELISYRGSDNFSIPVGCALFFLVADGGVSVPLVPILFIPAAALLSFLLYKINWLSRTGSLSAYILGIYLFLGLDYRWGITLLFFFVSSTVFTWMHRSIKKKGGRKRGRNVWQVSANSAVAVASSLACILTGNIIFIYFFVAAAAAATGDTWASELGPLLNKNCLSLSDLKIRTAGVSGGVSLFGTIAAAAGSFSTSMLGFWLFFQRTDISVIILLAAAGFLAVFIDSLLGAFIEPSILKWSFFKGKHGLDRENITPNDLVNFAASATAPLFFLLLYSVGK